MNITTDQTLVGGLIPISDREYRLLSDLIYDQFGINLGDQKRSLVTGRLNKVLRKLGYNSFKDYYSYVTNDCTGEALEVLVNRISTNYTYFNRESDHFDYFFQTVLPDITEILKKQNRRNLHIWCPGCSSGEEPYMLAMLILEFLDRKTSFWEPAILATDISLRVLEKAQTGIYEDENISKLSKSFRNKYFSRLTDGRWIVNDKIKEIVLFKRLNLMCESYPFRGKFQIIFCRNVMIYFDTPTREALVNRYHRYTEDGGYLFIGHSKTLGRSDKHYKYIKPSIYRKNSVLEMV